MTSAEREARDRAWERGDERGRFSKSERVAFDAAWDAARGATVAEIVEWLRDRAHWAATTDDEQKAIDLLVDKCEARFSPAAPPEREES